MTHAFNAKSEVGLLLALLFIIFPSVASKSQTLEEVGTDETSLDTTKLEEIRFELDALGFFRDNEYNSSLCAGYSLPGVRIQPRISYMPMKQINIEAGASMLFFNGANKYPCYAYHDIGTWKGQQYQYGAHAFPWVRLQASFKHLDVILGNIYGGSNHQLLRPLYNAEQNLSADPEMGLQLLWKLPKFKMDAWLNWQSYQFELDTHQEAFTVGVASEITWHNKGLQIYSPIQAVAQHRGGEQDQTSMGVQTICNGAVGLGIRQRFGGMLNGYDAQANALGCYQQSGKLWPFETGMAWHLGLKTKWWEHVTATIDYVYAPKQFVSMYGSPFYSTLSIKHGGTVVKTDGTIEGTYDHQYQELHNIRLGLDYSHTFAKSYTIGADIELYSLNAREVATGKGGQPGTSKAMSEFNFTFGVYFRISPSILIKDLTSR